MIAAETEVISAGIGALATVVVGFGVWVLTSKSVLKKQRRDDRASAYVDLLIVVEHILAAADAVAPMEGDFGSLREEVEMTPAERARVRAEVTAHGSRQVREDFTNLLDKYGEMQKWAMHIWDLHDRSRIEDFAVSDDYGLETLDELRAAMRLTALHLEQTVREELHGRRTR